ncbi:(2Fe-2S)-binding protein [Propionivibrio limicola]|uniref:(2Fe-2S)-binding protein n=1 Tax=Propionivibrio limicola TaxID=167645 RepID=UPI0012915A90|nr:(2Fe-2S)-binding protein [Propionivibrio limicola]
MYICVCKAITERQIREAVAGGAHSLKDLRHELGVASECGKCAEEAKRCLKAALEEIGHQHHHFHHAHHHHHKK